MQAELVSESASERVYAVIFQKGDEVLSGLTDFASRCGVSDAHFTAIGALSGVTLGWLSVPEKTYHLVPVREQVEVISMMGDIVTSNGKPVVHAHGV